MTLGQMRVPDLWDAGINLVSGRNGLHTEVEHQRVVIVPVRRWIGGFIVNESLIDQGFSACISFSESGNFHGRSYGICSVGGVAQRIDGADGIRRIIVPIGHLIRAYRVLSIRPRRRIVKGGTIERIWDWILRLFHILQVISQMVEKIIAISLPFRAEL